jgi:diguanylate cyclase (GGDEF)-like protein
MVADPPSSQQAVDTLRSALDEIELGVVLLDSDLRVRFVNRAFLRLYHLTDKAIVSGLDFEGLMRVVVGRRRALSTGKFNSYVKTRASEIRAGLEEPRDIRMDDGHVIRINCKTLPDGGRMLVYANVTDLVQQADRLKEMATVDGMTGLFNRRHFLALADIAWGRYQRYRRPLSLLMLDIDRFKSINDQFGHDIGDHVIMQVADICRQYQRKSDVIARFGGEEFLLLLPETVASDAREAAERLRRHVERTDLSIATHTIAATVSIGVAPATPNMRTLFDLIKAADHALYVAKNSGRNRVCCADPDAS